MWTCTSSLQIHLLYIFLNLNHFLGKFVVTESIKKKKILLYTGLPTVQTYKIILSEHFKKVILKYLTMLFIFCNFSLPSILMKQTSREANVNVQFAKFDHSVVSRKTDCHKLERVVQNEDYYRSLQKSY